jgi:alpha-1,6-mannosyltransferase
VVVLAVFAVLSWAARVGLGWIASLSTPGEVRTWLSPPTALGMTIGAALEWTSLGTVDAAIAFFRLLAMIVGAALCLWLVLRPEGRSPVRGAALALLAVVVLGPVLQPWYLLWVLPLLAATGLTAAGLRTVMLITSVLVVHGMAESNATADTLVDFIRDGAATVFAVVMVLVVLLSSPGERRLLLGHPVDRGIRPDSPEARSRAGNLAPMKIAS